MTMPPTDPLERALWKEGVEVTGEQLEMLWQMVWYASWVAADPFGSTLDVVLRDRREAKPNQTEAEYRRLIEGSFDDDNTTE